MICKKCGKEIDDDLKFCTYCGTRVKNPMKNPFENINFRKKSPNGGAENTHINKSYIIICVIFIMTLFVGFFLYSKLMIKDKCINLVKDHEYFGYTTEKILNSITVDGEWSYQKKEGQNRVVYSGTFKNQFLSAIKEAVVGEEYDSYYYEDEYDSENQEVSDDPEEILSNLEPNFKATFKVNPRTQEITLYTIENDGKIIPIENAKEFITLIMKYVMPASRIFLGA